MLVDGHEQAVGQDRRWRADVGGDLCNDATGLDGDLEKAITTGNQGVGGRADAFGTGADEEHRHAGGSRLLAQRIGDRGGVVVNGEQVENHARRGARSTLEGSDGTAGIARHKHDETGGRKRLRQRIEKRRAPRQQQHRWLQRALLRHETLAFPAVTR